jgi:predicted PurR-regulated permease PerM
MIKKLVLFSTAILTTLLALVLFWQLRVVVIYVLISLALAATIRPLVKRLEGLKLIVRLAWVLLYLVIIGAFGTLIFFTAKSAIVEIQLLGHSVAIQDTWILPSWLEGSTFQQTLTSWLPPPSMLLTAFTGDQGQLVLPAVLSFAQNAGSVVTGFVVILFLSIYWSINQVHFERLWLSLLPPGQRKQARGVWRVIEPEIGTYIRGTIIKSLIAGLILGLGFWIIGSPYPALLALVGVLASLVPIIGVVFLIIIVLLVGLLTSVPISLFTALFTAIVLIAIAIWVKPRILKGKWENHVVTLVLLIAMADAFGIIGLIIAPLISVICQIIWSRLVSHRRIAGAAEQLSDLKERQQRVREKVEAMAEPHLPLVTSSLERLDNLMLQAEPILKDTLPEILKDHPQIPDTK